MVLHPFQSFGRWVGSFLGAALTRARSSPLGHARARSSVVLAYPPEGGRVDCRGANRNEDWCWGAIVEGDVERVVVRRRESHGSTWGRREVLGRVVSPPAGVSAGSAIRGLRPNVPLR